MEIEIALIIIGIQTLALAIFIIMYIGEVEKTKILKSQLDGEKRLKKTN